MICISVDYLCPSAFLFPPFSKSSNFAHCGLFIYLLFLAALDLHCFSCILLLRRAEQGLLFVVVHSHCGGLSFCGAQAPGVWASVVAAAGSVVVV